MARLGWSSWRAASVGLPLGCVASGGAFLVVPAWELSVARCWVVARLSLGAGDSLRRRFGLLLEVLGGCCPSARWMVLVGLRFSSLCDLLAVLGFADATARCCSGGGAKLLGRAAQFLRGAGMCDDRMKIVHDFAGPAMMAPVGVVSLLGGVVELCLTFPLLVWSWLLSPGESLDSVGPT